MKKIILFLSLACFIIPVRIYAQYSNASLSGPWITNNDNSQIVYIIFDGAGNITQLGASIDSLNPVGTYSVTGPGAIAVTLNVTQGTVNLTGQMINDSSANLTGGIGNVYAYKVLNTGALEGTWSGVIFDTLANYSKNVTLTVNSTGVVTAATGITGLIAGHIYEGRDTFAGYITTTDDSCAFRAIQLAGIQYLDSLLGEGNLGANNSNCQSFAFAEFVQISNGIATIPAIDFSVYPNPFSEQIEISVNNPADKMQADLYDLYGRKVLSQPLATVKNTSLDAGTLSSGMYMLTLTDAIGQTTTKTVIKN
jgi:hypothetical protein